ncbi:hypothetical protein B0H13DRAFT_1899900 [Mycena leptocephala]|nr:hypothetical protein B0H13DRAFT_1899900 [Mycena leptocephala]
MTSDNDRSIAKHITINRGSNMGNTMSSLIGFKLFVYSSLTGELKVGRRCENLAPLPMPGSYTSGTKWDGCQFFLFAWPTTQVAYRPTRVADHLRQPASKTAEEGTGVALLSLLLTVSCSLAVRSQIHLQSPVAGKANRRSCKPSTVVKEYAPLHLRSNFLYIRTPSSNGTYLDTGPLLLGERLIWLNCTLPKKLAAVLKTIGRILETTPEREIDDTRMIA